MPANTAPGSLRLIQEFVNTLDLEEQKDSARTPAELASWLRSSGLLPIGEISPGEHGRWLLLRDTMRRLLLANNAGLPDPEDLAELNRLAVESRLTPRFEAGAVRLEPAAPGAAGALGRLLAVVADSMTDGTWSRLKACSDHGCQWAFYDRSKNHSGHWCSMQVCGNRAKARQFRERRRASS